MRVGDVSMGFVWIKSFTVDEYWIFNMAFHVWVEYIIRVSG